MYDKLKARTILSEPIWAVIDKNDAILKKNDISLQ
jgi:hypothetical protein